VWLDALALVVLGVFIGAGALRGALASGLSLFALVASYGAGLWAAPRLGPGLARALGTSELAGVLLAGVAASALAYAAAALLGALLRRRHRLPRGAVRGRRDRLFGGAFGALRGGVAVLLLAWLALLVDALRATGVAPALPGVEGSGAAAATSAVVEAGVGAALANAGPLGRVAARAAARPGPALASLQIFLESPRTRALQGDRLFWTYVEHGAVDAALNQGSCLALLQDPELREALTSLGVLESEAAAEPAAFRSALGEVLRELGPRLRRVREDPAFAELLADEVVVARVRAGDGLALLGHEGFRGLVARAAAPAPLD
jgi:hypothetical protein